MPAVSPTKFFLNLDISAVEKEYTNKPRLRASSGSTRPHEKLPAGFPPTATANT
jgi:hypothetical protein